MDNKVLSWNISSKPEENSVKLFNDKSFIKYEKNEDNKDNIINTTDNLFSDFIPLEKEVKEVYEPYNIKQLNDFYEKIKDQDKLSKKDLFDLTLLLKESSENLKLDIKKRGNNITDRVSYSQEEYEELIYHLTLIKNVCVIATNYFTCSKKNQIHQNYTLRIFFKTSCYKMCNQKSSCYIHTRIDKKKYERKCEQYHFVHRIVIDDIECLIKSLEKLELENLNWIMNDKSILGTYESLVDKKENEIDEEDENIKNIINHSDFKIKKIKQNIDDNFNYEQDCEIIIGKNDLERSFGTISYVLKHMFTDSSNFLKKNSTTDSLLINSN